MSSDGIEFELAGIAPSRLLPEVGQTVGYIDLVINDEASRVPLVVDTVTQSPKSFTTDTLELLSGMVFTQVTIDDSDNTGTCVLNGSAGGNVTSIYLYW